MNVRGVGQNVRRAWKKRVGKFGARREGQAAARATAISRFFYIFLQELQSDQVTLMQ
jgi:hypothetical protein